MTWQQLISRGVRSGRRRSAALQRVSAIESLEARLLLAAVTVQVTPSRDNTIYNVPAGDLSNARGDFLIVGGSQGTASSRRGLIGFDLTSAGIPDGSAILDVTLRMNVNSSIGGPAVIGLHRVLRNWGEGHSSALGSEYDGAPATPFDATWLFSLFDGTVWSNPGGDFTGASASMTVDATGFYSWTGGGVIADVQQWLDNPSTNFGWLLKGPEASGNIKTFDSKDSDNGALTPIMEITYEEPIRTGVVEGRKWHDKNGDGLREIPAVSGLNLQFRNGRDFFNLYGGSEYWYFSTANNSWYILTPNGDLTRWDGRRGQLTGQLVQQLDPRVWHNPRSILGNSGNAAEPWMNGFVVELLDESGVFVGSTVTRDLDLNNDGVIQEEAERGWYQFTGLTSGRYSVREATLAGWAQSANRSSELAARAFELDSSLGLTGGNLHENFGGRGERWLTGTGGAWYFITPVGEFYRWNGRAVSLTSPLSGTLLESFTASYFRDVSLLHSAFDPALQLNSVTPAAQRDFGGYQPAVISGRTWNDINPDGRRNHPQLSTAVPTSVPAGAPAGTTTLPWYTALVPESELRTGGSDTTLVQTYFYVASGGRIFRWNTGTAAILLTTVSDAAGFTVTDTVTAGLVAESWISGSTVELLDDRGNVVRSVTSADRDGDGNGQIDVERERGWYEFDGLGPGQYSIRVVSGTGTVQSTSAPASVLTTASQLVSTFGFKPASRDHFNFGGRGERWFHSRSNDWYYMTPNGSVFEWDKNSGGSRGLVRGRQVGQLSSACFLNLDLLFSPPSNSITLQSQRVRSALNLGSCRVLDSVFASLAGEIR